MARALRERLPLGARARLRMLGAVPLMHDLDRLARWYGTDKAIGQHGYTILYERHLRHYGRLDRLAILEIGVGGRETNSGGPSLRMWRSFFPRARIIGVDIYPKSLPQEARITVVQGDQADVAFLADLARQYGPFDVIVDDGSHRGDDINRTFEFLWPHLRGRGEYVIEDVSTAYDTAYGGGPPGAENTSLSLLKDLLDGVQGASSLGLVGAVHVYADIAFIDKK